MHTLGWQWFLMNIWTEEKLKFMLTAVIVTYHPPRREHILPIFNALKSGSIVPDEIIFWNNGKDYLGAVGDAIVINSSKNFGCSVRIYAGLMATNDIVFVQDDDLLVGHDSVRLLYEFCSSVESCLVGPLGNMLGPQPHPYLKRVGVVNKAQEADIILGRMFVCRKLVFSNVFRDRINNYIRTSPSGDDIVLSLTNKHNSGMNYVLPVEIINLNEKGIGYSHEPTHYIKRDYVCNQIINYYKKKDGY